MIFNLTFHSSSDTAAASEATAVSDKNQLLGTLPATFGFKIRICTECPKTYRKSVLHLL